jgi:CDP-diacylglycerol--serine O-phosphatidyltransferase
MTQRSDEFDFKPQRRIRAVALLPSLLTLGNLLCGFISIVYASRWFEPIDPSTYVLGYWTPLTISAVLVFVGMIFDGLDGWVARLTGSYSELGEQLDSMADMITFGLAPAFLVVQLADIGTPFVGSDTTDTYLGRITFVLAAVYVACAALRLARFNLEQAKDDLDATHGHNAFTGLPSPGAAGTVAAIVILHQSRWAAEPSNLWALLVTGALVAVMLGVALAMVSRLPYTHVVNRHLRHHAPFRTIVVLILVVAFSWIEFQASLAVGFIVYVMTAPAQALLKLWRSRARRHRDPSQTSMTDKAA